MKNKILRLVGVIIFTFIIIASISACDTLSDTLPDSLPGSANPLSAAEVVEAYYTAQYENRFDDLLQYIDEQSLNIYSQAVESFESWRKRNSDLHFDNDITLEGILVESIGSIGEYEGFRVRVRLNFNGENRTFDEQDTYVIGDNDGYKVIVGNIIGVGEQVSSISRSINDNQIKLTTSYLYRVNGFAVVIEYTNESNVEFRFGWVNPSSVILETDVSTYSENIPLFTSIPPHGSDRVTALFNDAGGEVKQISVTNIVELDARGLPARTGGGDTIVLWDITDAFLAAGSEIPDNDGQEPEPEFDPEQVDLSSLSAVETVELYFTSIYNGFVEFAVGLLDEESLEASGLTKEGAVDAINAHLTENNYALKNMELQSVGSLNGFDGFSVSLTVDSGGFSKALNEGIHRTVRRDDGYKILVNDFISVVEPEPPNLDNNDFNIYASKVVKRLDSYTVTIEIVNNSSRDFAPGWTQGSSVIITTDEGTYSASLFMMNQHINTRFRAHHAYNFTVTIDNVSGNAQNISVDRILRLDNRGFPAGHNTTGTTHVIYERDR